MAQPKLSAPVGQTPRTSPGDRVANNKDDVILIQTMLKANGFPVAIDGKMNPGVQKAIAAARKKLTGEVRPDAVIDKNDDLTKAMTSKYNAYLTKLEKERFYTLPAISKHPIPESEYFAIQKQILKHLDGICKVQERTYQYYHKIHIDCLKAGAGQEGMLKAISTAVVVSIGMIKLPDQAKMRNAEAAVKRLRSAISAKNFAVIDAAMQRCERALDIYYAELIRYLSEPTRTAFRVGTSLQVTTAAGWIVVGAMATPVVMTATGLGVAGASAVGGAGVAAMQSASNEIGSYGVGKQDSFGNAIWNIAVDGTVGAIGGAIGSKLPEPFKKVIAERMSGAVASRLTWLASDKAKEVIIAWVSHAGAEVAAEALAESVKLMGIVAKKGKPPTQKDFEAAFQSLLFKGLASNFLKNLEGFEKFIVSKNKKYMTTKMLPDAFMRVAKGPVPPDVQKKVVDTIVKKYNEEISKAVFGFGIEKVKGKETKEVMYKTGHGKMERDPKIKKKIDDAVRAELKKNKCPVK